jgi:VWFA-related protein
MDNHSRYTSKELRELAVESDAQIYTIAPGDASAMAPFGKAMALSQQRQGLQFLDELAARTGGIAFVVRDQKELAKAVVSIGHALRNQYTIGYVPHSDGRKAEWRRIKVKVAGSGLRAYARAGYRPD